MRPRQAFTLLELCIAVGIFSMLLAMLLQLSISLRSYADYDAVANDLEFEGRNLVNELSNDLCNSARLYIAGATRYPVLYKTAIDSDTDWDELEFLRLRTERTMAAKPSDLHFQAISFSDEAQKPVPFNRYWEGKPITSLVLDPDASVGAELDQIAAPVWETNQAGLDYAANGDPANARVFRYDLDDDAQTGRKVLYRKYKNPGDETWTVDKELGRNIDSLTIDLAESLTSLNRNQVRFSITLIKGDAAAGTRVKRVIEGSVALRSISPQGP